MSQTRTYNGGKNHVKNELIKYGVVNLFLSKHFSHDEISDDHSSHEKQSIQIWSAVSFDQLGADIPIDYIDHFLASFDEMVKDNGFSLFV